jgi:hypothetical protein
MSCHKFITNDVTCSESVNINFNSSKACSNIGSETVHSNFLFDNVEFFSGDIVDIDDNTIESITTHNVAVKYYNNNSIQTNAIGLEFTVWSLIIVIVNLIGLSVIKGLSFCSNISTLYIAMYLYREAIPPWFWTVSLYTCV